MKKSLQLVLFLLITIYAINLSAYADDAETSAEVSGGEANTSVSDSESQPTEDTSFTEDEEDFVDVELETVFVQDPAQPVNRAIFTFNDKAYYYVFRPMSNGYKAVVPAPARKGVRSFFLNIRTPVRFFNCIFQGKFKGAGTEALRLVINTTLGVGGFSDPAKKYFKLEIQDEDFGQTLGKYKMGSGPFIEMPLLGPSNLRDTIGFLGDVALDPITLLGFFVSPFASAGARSYNGVNDVSIDKGDTYEGLVEQAIDPYIAVQEAYTQNRDKKISE